MYATINISVGEERALSVPRSAVIRLGDHFVVFVQRGDAPNGLMRFERVPVVIDEATGTPWLQLIKGPERGTRIVTAGAIMLLGMMS
jgi:hypothetical protein